MLYKTRVPGSGNIARLMLQMQQRKSYLIAQRSSYSLLRSSSVNIFNPTCRPVKQAPSAISSTNGASARLPSTIRRDFATSPCRCQNHSFGNQKASDQSTAKNEHIGKSPPKSAPGAKPGAPATTGGETTTQQQRKADWAIMREMLKYLWPKVRLILFFSQVHTTC